jgi:hypothetical protein
VETWYLELHSPGAATGEIQLVCHLIDRKHFLKHVHGFVGGRFNTGIVARPQAAVSVSSVSSSTSGRTDCGMEVSVTWTVWMELPATTVISY